MTQAWIFQANPEHYDILRAVTVLERIEFRAARSADRMAAGDEVWLWTTKRDWRPAGVIALGRIAVAPRPLGTLPDAERFFYAEPEDADTPKDFDYVQVEIVDRGDGRILAAEALKSNAGLSGSCLGRPMQGTNFTLAPDEHRILAESWRAFRKTPDDRPLPLDWSTPVNYAAMQIVADRLFRQSRSIFAADRPPITRAVIDEFRTRFLDNPIFGADSSFGDKLERQFTGCSPACAELLASILYTQAFHAANIRAVTKLALVRRALEFGRVSLSLPAVLVDGADGGLTRNQAFKQQRYWHTVTLTKAVSDLATMDARAKARVLGDPYMFRDWLAGHGDTRSASLLQIVPFMLFPGRFEQISSVKGKRDILEAFADELPAGPTQDLDRDLASLRERLTPRFGRNFHFYWKNVARFWDPESAGIDGDAPESPEGTPGVDGAAVGTGIRTWLVGTGNSAEHWQRFKAEGTVRISFSNAGRHLGDLSGLVREQVETRLKEIHGSRNPTNGSLACWQFGTQIKPGDRIIARAGRNRILGVGTVAGPYRYESETADFPHVIPVEWTETSERRLPEKIHTATKTLTEITNDLPYVEVLTGQRTQAAVDFLGSRGCDAGEIDRYFAQPRTGAMVETPRVTDADSPSAPRSLFSEAFPGKFLGRDELNAMVEELERKKALILQGPPGTGKTFIATALAEHLAEDPRRVTRLQFHPAYSYEDFIRGIRPSAAHFEAVDGPLVEAARRAMHDPKRHVLLIDEFNRGNVARILGESLSLIEADKRDRRHAVRLGLAGEALPGGEPHELWLPPNLYILATMNTADRSIALVDHALRRRFSFIDLAPAFDDRAFEEDLVDRFDGDAGEMDAREVADVKAVAADIVKAMREINGRIAAERSLGAGHCLGHSFFCGDPANRDIRDWARRIFEREIKPHLRECCADQPRLLDDLLRLVPALDR